MDPERWQQIDKLLDEALDREPGQRKIFLEQACAGDEELRDEVEALLTAHEKAGILSPSEHLCRPVKCGVRIASAERLDKSARRIDGPTRP